MPRALLLYWFSSLRRCSGNEKKLSEQSKIVADAAETAKSSGLRYITDEGPGIRRTRSGTGFRYYDSAGKPLRDKDELARIKSLAIPPAWTNVWISPFPNSHLQATGRDARGRKQYRYHPQWRQVRDQTKYDRLIAVVQKLPALRARVAEDLAHSGLPRAKVVATVVKLLETTLIRVGNEEYARENRSFGLTTLRNKHVEVKGSKIYFHFCGKSGVGHELAIDNPRLARIVRRLNDLPGQELFQYVDEAGEARSVGSNDVNEYLRDVTGEEFTAKDFRTWAGTVLAVRALHDLPTFESQAQAKRNLVKAIETVAKRLGNTRSVCRKCYIHPAVVASYRDGSLARACRRTRRAAAGSTNLTPEEAAVMKLLEQKQSRRARRARRKA